MDIFEKCYGYTEAKEAIANGTYPYFIPMTESEGNEAVFQGQRLIMCGSNNYLGLTTDPRVHQAAIEAVERFGTSCTGSRFLNGTLELHERLEHELAEWVGKEAALVFSTGMQTNLGVISALVMRGDVILLDKDDHASLVDGARLALGETRRFRHNDMADLERVLAGIPAEKGKLVVVDGLYSMGGDLAPLPEIAALCKKYGARLMVDDAHGLGVMGGGRGTAAHFGVTKEVDLIMSTFSKSFASLGGFIAGDEQVVHYIKHHARSLIFSASIPAANAAAALAALKIMREEPERVERLDGDRRPDAPRTERDGLQHRQVGFADHPDHHRRQPADAAGLEERCSKPACLSTRSCRRRCRRGRNCCAPVTWRATPMNRSTACWRSIVRWGNS